MMDSGKDTGVIEAIMVLLGSIIALVIVVIALGPVIDYFTWYLMSIPESPYTNFGLTVLRWFYPMVFACGIVAFIWLYKVLIKKIRYTRNEDNYDW
jgi:hypothetical protein